MSVVPLLARLIGDPANTWAIGVHGALAEFRREPSPQSIGGSMNSMAGIRMTAMPGGQVVCGMKAAPAILRVYPCP